jgi:hypothetical protein
MIGLKSIPMVPSRNRHDSFMKKGLHRFLRVTPIDEDDAFSFVYVVVNVFSR